MRILVVWAESLSKTSGGASHFRGLTKGLAGRGHQVAAISPLYRGQESMAFEGVSVRRIAMGRRGMLSFAAFQMLTLLCLPRWLSKYRPDAVYARACFLCGPMSLICRLAGVPLVSEIDSIVDQEVAMRGWSSLLANLIVAMDRLNNRLCSGLICVTSGLRQEAIRRGASPARTIVVHNGASTDIYAPGDRQGARQELSLPQEVPLFGFAGSLAPWQGLELLVAAAKELRSRGRQLSVAIMGDGPTGPALCRQISDLGLHDVVRLLPAGDHARVRAFLQACDALVVPIHDMRKLRYGLSVLKFWDALAAGLPVIVPANCELQTVLHNLNLPGEFASPDAAALADAMDEVIANLGELRDRRWEIHDKAARDYSWQAAADSTADFLGKLAGRSKSGSSR